MFFFLKEFIALQAVRTNKAFSVARNKLICAGIDLNSLTPEEQNTVCIHCLFSKELHNDTRIEEAMYNKFLGKMKNKDYNMIFLKIVDDEARFFASDNPVVINIRGDEYDFLLPLNEKYAIFIYNSYKVKRIDEYSIILKKKKAVDNINKDIIANADRYIMSNNFTQEEIDFLQNIT